MPNSVKEGTALGMVPKRRFTDVTRDTTERNLMYLYSAATPKAYVQLPVGAAFLSFR